MRVGLSLSLSDVVSIKNCFVHVEETAEVAKIAKAAKAERAEDLCTIELVAVEG